LQFLREVTTSARGAPADGPSAGLRARVLASRASGARTILPVHDAVRRAPRWLSPAIAAVLLGLLAGTFVVRRPREIEAGTTSGTLTFAPAMPLPGQRVTVSYRPSALLSDQPWLALRARLRAPSGESYNAGVPVVTVATLHRADDGTFAGTFALPDSVVFAALAVEDSSASVIDDNGSRAWELLVSDRSGRPLFAALEQRANDMMGRNWEEGFATVQRMVALYPDTLRGWLWLRAYHNWLGRSEDDSIRALHRTRLAAFESEFAKKTPSPDEEGMLAWYAQGTDSSTAARWRSRLLREAPTNSFAIQWRLLSVFDSLRARHDTVWARRQLDTLWAQAPRDRRAQVADAGTGLAFASRDTTLIRRWTTRLSDSENDARASARRTALNFTRLPSLRSEGIARLRAEIDSLMTLEPTDRALDETLAEQRARQDRLRRQTMATLGQALVADGRPAEAREVLAEATSIGWNLGVFATVRSASLLAGDTSSALRMAARIIADPRTPASFGESVDPIAVRQLGESAWTRELDSARALFVQRMLAGASVRTLARKARVRSLDGKTESIADLTKGRVSVVAFWSRFCGPAIQELPQLNEVAARLARDGIPVVSIVDEPKPSPELRAFLKDKQVTVPVYLDSWHEASRAFNQWGTPYYYVVDAEGRIRFDVTLSADEALAQAEALRLATRVVSSSARR
ncbi:MAG TPA: TlpA disulfide reductase family protein, partial [Gemmatimonadaceae bacterium]